MNLEKERLIGLSLSLCIKDLVQGKLEVEQVEKIVCSTRARSTEDWEEIIEVYGEYYWHKDPEKGKKIFTRLQTEGKIEQPGLKNRNFQQKIVDGYWQTKSGQKIRL